MLRTRPTFSEDFLHIEIDQVTKDELGEIDLVLEYRDRGLIDELTTAYWDDFDNVQAIYGVFADDPDHPEVKMIIADWIKKEHPVYMARLARQEIRRMARERGENELWLVPARGYDEIPRWFTFLGFEQTTTVNQDGLSLWKKCFDSAKHEFGRGSDHLERPAAQ